MPFLQIRDWLLADHSYGIAMLAFTLLHTGAWTAGTVATLFLVIAPIGMLVAATALWRRQRRDEPAARVQRHLEIWRRWSMLDVFGLALAVFLVEGEQLMRTEVRWGALFLVAMVAIRWGLDVLLARGNERR
jgi:uncharacterized paraquat-inducible protein A